MSRAAWLWTSGLCCANALWAFGVGERKGGALFGALAIVLLLLYVFTAEDMKETKETKEKRT
jgi:hypothetical protein